MPQLPPVPVCRTCGAPADYGQEYCLECGNRLLPARRAPAVAAWVVPALVALAVGANAARAKAFSALRKGLRQVGVLVSSSYPSLQPGYYVVFSGVYASLAEAQSSLDRAKAVFPGAYARPIAR